MKHIGYLIFLSLIVGMLLVNFYPTNTGMFIYVLVASIIASVLIIFDYVKGRRND